MTQVPAPIVSLDKLNTAAQAEFGAKAATLGELWQLGMRVPPGFALGRAAFVQWQPESADFPQSLAPSLFAAWQDLLPQVNRQAVAVRSSASLEDRERHSNAGLFYTELNVATFEAVKMAIIRCWQSLYQAGRPTPQDFMGVVVQTMVAPDYASVLFTRHPLGAHDDPVVEAIPEQGDRLMSGEVEPLRVRLNASPDTNPPLPATLLSELLAVAQRLEGHFGQSVDVEWAWKDPRLITTRVYSADELPAALPKLAQEIRQLDNRFTLIAQTLMNAAGDPTYVEVLSQVQANSDVIMEAVIGSLFPVTRLGRSAAVTYHVASTGDVARPQQHRQSTYYYFDGRFLNERPLDPPRAVELPASLIAAIADHTRRYTHQFGHAAIEWAIENGRLLCMDAQSNQPPPASAPGDMIVVSPGLLSGPAYLIQDVNQLHDTLDALNQRGATEGGQTIFIADFPDRRLAALIPYAGGFIFRSGSILCHLAILLRERC